MYPIQLLFEQAMDFKSENPGDELLADLVSQPVNELLAPVRYGPRQSMEREQSRLPEGGFRYYVGTFYVDVSVWGLIRVRQSDWLSKFAQAIHGDASVADRFARIDGSMIVPIQDEDFIVVGETLLHLPTYQLRRSENEDMQLIINGNSYPLPRLEPFDPQTAFEKMRRQAQLEEASEAGYIDGLSSGRLFSESGFRAMAITAIRDLLDVWLGENSEFALLSEEEKQVFFTYDSEKTTKILYYEFLSGDGPEVRNFDESHQVTRDLMEGPISVAIRAEIGRRKASAVKSFLRIKSDEGIEIPVGLVDLGVVSGRFAFSPDETMANANRNGRTEMRGAGDSLSFHIQATREFLRHRPIEAFVGGCSYVVDTSEFRWGPSGLEYSVVVTNQTSLRSLFAHGQMVENLSRPSALEAALREEEKKLPYSTIEQRFHAYIGGIE